VAHITFDDDVGGLDHSATFNDPTDDLRDRWSGIARRSEGRSVAQYQIGVDMGGTFTDAVVIDENGNLWADKAATTPSHLLEGLVNALEALAEQAGIPLEEMLADCNRFVHGTTIVTNSIAELRGARVGVLTTEGFSDSLRIARSPRTDERDNHKQLNVPDIAARDAILEVPERVNKHGEVITALDMEACEKAVRRLVEDLQVESIAVTFLWSFLNDTHERQVHELITKLYPDVHVSLSSRIYPMIREYERTVTTVLNAFTAPKVARYVDEMTEALTARGLRVPVAFMQASGGSLSADEAREVPIVLLDSGPVGGVVGANALAKELKIPSVITGDMGGTSFDTSVIAENRLTMSARSYVQNLLTGLTKVDVVAIGSGGGSVGWADPRGLLQVGPHSAGADPGPVCYGRGGEQPTVTDAMVSLGFMDPDYFLGGRAKLHKDKADDALRALGEKLGLSLSDTAAAIYRVVVASMSNAVRGITVERGHDPRVFTFFAYGGALPLFLVDICRELGIKQALVPNASAVFSASGLLASDDMRVPSKSRFWSPGQPVDDVNEVLRELEGSARQNLLSSGYDDSEIVVQRHGDLKFQGQIFELTVPLPDGEISQAALEDLAERFPAMYEAEYGPGTAWVDAGVVMMAVRVEAKASTRKYRYQGGAAGHDSAASAAKAQRAITVPATGERITVPVLDGDTLAVGEEVVGPAIIEKRQTTIFLPEDSRGVLDSSRNLLIDTHL
jgi:N-methylhydantoinase A